jgi:UDP-N-acetylmuramoylalanine--D-glutamate ligase
VLVVGLARTGVVTALCAASRGASVTATDEKPESKLVETAAKMREAGVKLELGGHAPGTFSDKDLIVLSPGVPANLPELTRAGAAGIPVWSDVELAWRFLRGKLVAITGSNGKTTTTALACCAHFEDRRNSNARRRQYWHAAAFAGGGFDTFDSDRR